MRLEVIKDIKNCGYIINLFMGDNIYTSWWSSPPKNIDHTDVTYLRDRYYIITTKKRAEDYKMLFKNLWIQVSEETKKEMLHCLGLDYKKKPYRNRFCTNKDNKTWNTLIEQGLAEKGTEVDSYGNVTYWLTKQGLCYILNKSVSDNYYVEL